MAKLLVPHEVSATTADIWLAAANEPPIAADTVLEIGGRRVPLDIAGWRRWPRGGEPQLLQYRTAAIRHLSPGIDYRLTWRDPPGNVLSEGSVTTLPERLPAIDETPFTVLLASCFCEARQGSDQAGATYFHMPHARRAVLKFLCGDQVYLDDPASYFLLNTHRPQELRRLFFDNYLRTWSQWRPASGFLEILKSGANYFGPDDHELWNNAPNFASLIRDTWRAGGRNAWLKEALELYRIFQTERLLTFFRIDPLSFLVVDTRTAREAGSRRFMPAAEMDRVRQWVADLDGPGVLVIGQPVFEERGGRFSQWFVDRSLPDYDQYRELIAALASSQHSIVMLTGDVHYGRLARCRLPGGAELIEVVSSPMALVDRRVGGRWSAAPSYFPAESASGGRIGRIETERRWKQTANHFVTLEFHGVGQSARMQVRDWPAGVPPVDNPVGAPITLR
jgi:hypothetical protein